MTSDRPISWTDAKAAKLPTIATASLSSSLRAACSDPVEWSYHDAGGATPTRQAWALPAVITDRLKSEAAAALSRARAALDRAPVGDVRAWLASLGVLCAGQMPAADARLKLAAYAPLLDHPASCFTQDTLREAGRAFKWFPAFAELTEFLDRKAEPARSLAYRLEKVAQAPVTEVQRLGPGYGELSPERKAAFDAMMAPFRAARLRLPKTEPRKFPALKPVHVPMPEELKARYREEDTARSAAFDAEVERTNRDEQDRIEGTQ